MIERIARHTIKRLPTGMGFAVTRAIAARPARPPLRDIEAEAMAGAERLDRLGWSGDAAWGFGSGPNVLLVHGWGGRAAQMAPLAASLAARGMRAVIFDVAGHGESAIGEARWEYFIRDVGEMAARIGKVAAFVGHSAGGLTMMAARAVNGARADRYVCVCTPSHPHPPMRAIAQRLDPGPAVLARYRRYLGDQFNSTWDELEAGAAFAEAGEDLLLCYDETDRYIDHTDGERVHALCPGSTLTRTNGYGHVRILASPELGEAVGVFINRS